MRADAVVGDLKHDVDKPDTTITTCSSFSGVAAKAGEGLSGGNRHGFQSMIVGMSWSATWRHWALALSASSWAKAVATKAETTRRPCLPAWASRLRAKCMRHGRMMATMLAGIAQFESDLLSERVKSGLAAARARGKKLGRQPGQRPKSDRLAPKVLHAVDDGRSYRWIARDLGISKNTVTDIVKRHRTTSLA